ncbi:uncharacterized protein VTP21DRAFT_3377 [Calcarisporiella thermophila]|uniref:uncharacterized protein n=1 Tax=Calcarisporiella thermophila TaxID=911321 RepID=UPI003743ED61
MVRDLNHPLPTSGRGSRGKRGSRRQFRFTSFPAFPPIQTTKPSSTYLRSDTSYFPGYKAGAEELLPDPEKQGDNVIIIHPGSRYLRIGKSSDYSPRVVPHAIARRLNTPLDTMDEDHASPDAMKTTVKNDGISLVDLEIKQRMKAAKRKAVSNANAQVVGFNKSVEPEIIEDHNDPYKVEWTDLDDSPEYLIGEKALRLPDTAMNRYKLVYPFKHGGFNEHDYDSVKALIADVETIWTEAIKEELEIDPKDLKKCNAVLVIPDLYNKSYVCELITLLLRYIGFQAVLIQQESVCATFGAGISAACVVDIGAQTTSVGCVEDGMCISASRVSLTYGGDDITQFFVNLLKKNQFPYGELQLSLPYGWKLAEELKERFCTINEAEISVQVGDFYVRVPRQRTRKYQFKLYDEVIKAPLCLFVPQVIDFKKKFEGRRDLFCPSVVDDILDDVDDPFAITGPPTGARYGRFTFTPSMTGVAATIASPYTASPQMTPIPANGNGAGGEGGSRGGTPVPLALKNEANTLAAQSPPSTSATAVSTTPTERPTLSSLACPPLALDHAVVRSIQHAVQGFEERAHRFYTTILLVGGGGIIPGFDRLLQEKVLETAGVERVEVVQPPREMDPRLVVWKGASVLSKLETAREMWVGTKEWEEMGARALKERVLFVW